MNYKILGFLLALVISDVQAQDVYKLFTKEGKEISLDKLTKEVAKDDLILFGELHNNPACHWMQLRLSKSILAESGKMMMGAEMFESDNQLIMDEYFSDIIRAKDFEKEARLWDNYSTDYKPLVEFAKENNLQFVATNVPRRYASMVSRKGLPALDSLSQESKSFIAPLPIAYDTTNPSVQKMLNMDFGHGKGGDQAVSMAKAQCVKDATMAHFIVKNKAKKVPFLHFQGDFHSANYGGIYWYVKQVEPKWDISIISTVEIEGEPEFKDEYSALGDYILVITSDLTKTY